MALWGAFSDSIDAIQAQSNALAVISQNIGNINTVGYKQTTDNFETVLSESTAQNNIFGVQGYDEHNNDVQGSFETTGLWDNLAINGPGFFILNSSPDGTGTTYYSRAGNFAEAVVNNSSDAYLTDGRGNYLMGVAGGSAPATGSTSGLTAVQFALGSTLAGKPTTQIAIQGSLPADDPTATSSQAQAQQVETALTTTNATSTPGFDPSATQVFNTGTLQIQLGTINNQNQTFTPGSAGAVTVNITDGSLNGVASAINAANAGVTAQVVQDSSGNYQIELTGNTAGAADAFVVTGADAPGGTAQSLSTLDYSVTNNANYTTFQAAQDASTGSPTSTSGVPLYDNQGNTQTLTLNFTKTASDTWQVTYGLDPNVGTIVASGASGTGSSGTATGPTTDLSFDGAGNFLSQSGNSSITVDWADGSTSTVSVDFSKMSQLASGSLIVNAASQNGYSSATMVKAEFDSDGNLYGDYSNGQKVLLYQVPVATFTAPDSLESVSGTEFTQTAAAGTLTVDPANDLNDTSFTPGTLESSNVDLGTQFSDMITTQAAYNAATKVFQTADSMMTNIRDLIT